jgi:hypothetical protein
MLSRLNHVPIVVSEYVRFTPHSEETFLIGRPARGDSAKTYEFSVPVTAALIGGFVAFPRKA